MLVHGGIGREFSPVWGGLPTGWHQLCVSVPDFLLLGGKSDFTAMRAWKLLQQVDDLEAKGAVFPNLRGFFNLAAFADHADFELVPVNMRLAPTYLHSDFMLPFRHAVRSALDRHASMALRPRPTTRRTVPNPVDRLGRGSCRTPAPRQGELCRSVDRTVSHRSPSPPRYARRGSATSEGFGRVAIPCRIDFVRHERVMGTPN